VDGMDLLTVRGALAEAIERARREKRPTLLEIETYRYRGHSMSDPGKYRSKEEVEEMMRHDPILRFSGVLAEQHKVAQAELAAIDKEVLAQVDESVRFAEQSPWPTLEELYQDVYVRSPYIHAKAAEKDPAWRAAQADDRVPETFPAWTQQPAPAKVEG